jgi:hypothetical protein
LRIHSSETIAAKDLLWRLSCPLAFMCLNVKGFCV